jgi:hypothetical protein
MKNKKDRVYFAMPCRFFGWQKLLAVKLLVKGRNISEEKQD